MKEILPAIHSHNFFAMGQFYNRLVEFNSPLHFHSILMLKKKKKQQCLYGLYCDNENDCRKLSCMIIERTICFIMYVCLTTNLFCVHGFKQCRRFFSSRHDVTTRHFQRALSAINTNIQELFSTRNLIHPYWQSKLERVSRPSAQSLIRKLVPDNPLGFSPASGLLKEGTLLNFIMEEKKKHYDKILLVRCGDFYETYGVDAIMLVEYAGLNPMAGKPKAGCPIKNIQVVLDSLTEAGFMVAVYEEIDEINTDRGVTAKVSPPYNRCNRICCVMNCVNLFHTCPHLHLHPQCLLQ